MIRTSWKTDPSGLPDFLQKACKQHLGFVAKGVRNADELKDVNATLTSLDDRDEGLILPQSMSQIGLCKTRLLPHLNDQFDEVSVIASKDRLWHRMGRQLQLAAHLYGRFA